MVRVIIDIPDTQGGVFQWPEDALKAYLAVMGQANETGYHEGRLKLAIGPLSLEVDRIVGTQELGAVHELPDPAEYDGDIPKMCKHCGEAARTGGDFGPVHERDGSQWTFEEAHRLTREVEHVTQREIVEVGIGTQQRV